MIECLWIYACGGVLQTHERWLKIGEKASTGDDTHPEDKGEYGSNFGGDRNDSGLVPEDDRFIGTSVKHRGVQGGQCNQHQFETESGIFGHLGRMGRKHQN